MSFTTRRALHASACGTAISFLFCISAHATLIYGVASQGNSQFLVTFDTSSPTNVLSSVPLSGLGASDSILGIDIRPATGQLYALRAKNSIYEIATISSTGAVTSIGSSGVTVNGFGHGFDFDPTIDRIRVVTDTDKNYLFDPNTGALQTTGADLAYASGDPNFGHNPNVIGAAYSNNFNGAATSQLYGIDIANGVLVTQANSTGVLTTVGAIGQISTSLTGFDIPGTANFGYATGSAPNDGTSSLFQVNLATGNSFSLGNIGIVVTAMTVELVPEPSTCATAIAGACIILLKQRNSSDRLVVLRQLRKQRNIRSKSRA
jgi:hypothetical protein